MSGLVVLPGAEIPVNFGDGGALVANAGPGTVSYTDVMGGSADGTIASAAAATLYGTQYLSATTRCDLTITLNPPQASLSGVRFPNAIVTDEANSVVNALQLGEDGSGTLKEQHFTSADQTGTGRGANMTVNPGASAGANQQGAGLTLADGISTGNGIGGGILFMTSGGGTPGSQQVAQVQAWFMWGAELERAFTPYADNAYDIGYDTLRVRRFKMGEYVELSEMTAPAAPAANTVRLFCRDNGSGKTQLCAQFPTGAIQAVATEP